MAPCARFSHASGGVAKFSNIITVSNRQPERLGPVDIGADAAEGGAFYFVK